MINKFIRGYQTKKNRIKLGLSKTHINDAIAMLNTNKIKGFSYVIYPLRSKTWKANPTKTCEEKRGFRHGDIVVAEHRRLRKVHGKIRSLKKICITLWTNFSNNFPVVYTKTKLLYRPTGLGFVHF